LASAVSPFFGAETSDGGCGGRIGSGVA
jgi:hypothetical protein